MAKKCCQKVSPAFRRTLLSPSSSAPDPDAEAFFAAAESAGTPVTDAYKTRYRNYISYLKARNKWTISDSRFIWATGNEVWAKIDIKTPSRTVTLRGSYAGRFTADRGWNGNGTGFAVLTNFNPGDGGTYNFTRNDASFGALILDNDSVASKQEVSCCNTGYTQGIVMNGFNPTDRTVVNCALNPTTSYTKYRFNSYCWRGASRTGSTTGYMWMNGMLQQVQTSASTALENKAIAIMGAYNGAFSAGFYTSNSHAVFYAGSGALDQSIEMDAYNYAFGYANRTNITKRITFEGDSRTASVSLSSYSNQSAYPKAVLTGLGDNWSGQAVAEANETMQQIVTQYATEILPYRNTSLTKDIIYLFAGTNDIENGRTGAQVYADIVTFCTTAKADGFKVVVFGEIDRNWGSYVAMDAERAALRTLMLADFGTSVSTNIYSGGSYADYYVDLYGEATFQSYLSADYQVDGVHPDASGSALIGTYGVTVGNLL